MLTNLAILATTALGFALPVCLINALRSPDEQSAYRYKVLSSFFSGALVFLLAALINS